MMSPYTGTHEYLKDYYSLLALRLHQEVLLARLLRGQGTEDAFLGLFLSDEDIDAILAELHGATVSMDESQRNLSDNIEGAARYIQSRLDMSPAPLRTRQLAGLFDLSAPAIEVLLLALAPEIDSRFGRVYAYLQDDVSRRWLSPGLAMRLLPGRKPTDPASRGLFTSDSILLRENLITVDSGTERLPTPLIDRAIKLDDRIVEYLLEHDALDPQLTGIAQFEEPLTRLEDLHFAPELDVTLRHLVMTIERGARDIVLFHGRAGSGKRSAAAAIANRVACSLLTVDGARLAQLPIDKVGGLLQRCAREARLRGALMHLRSLDMIPADYVPVVLREIREGTIITATDSTDLQLLREPPVEIRFPDVGHGIRSGLWKARLNGKSPQPDDVAEELAARFRLTPGEVERSVRAARHIASLREGPDTLPGRDDLFEGARRQLNPALAKLAQKISSPYVWEDLVLPAAQMTQLRAIESQVRHSQTVYGTWGFGARLALGKGLTALFSGPSGTGKTMAAGIVANALDLDMYKIDLSGVVSKYIGETEKNLSRIFEEADTAGGILFFDEADALFGKRSEVKDAHDRYANIEISYLLQRMEEYEGIAILATNFNQNLDEAFTRRMQFVIDLPLPGPGDRQRIWEGLFPPEAPVEDTIDFRFLSASFELSGGNIKNAVLAAAFLAANDQSPIAMSHLVQGVARELGKLGRPLTRADFAGYYTMAREDRR